MYYDDRLIRSKRVNETAPRSFGTGEGEQRVTPFKAYKGTRRKPGTGYLSQINETLWEGRYSPIWPDGKKHPRNIYAHTQEACEATLAKMIRQVNAEISTAKKATKEAAHAMPKGA